MEDNTKKTSPLATATQIAAGTLGTLAAGAAALVGVSVAPSVAAGVAATMMLGESGRATQAKSQVAKTLEHESEVAALTDPEGDEARHNLAFLLQRVRDITVCMRAHVGDPTWEQKHGIILAAQAKKDIEALPVAMRDEGRKLDMVTAQADVSHAKAGLDRVFDKTATPELAQALAIAVGSHNRFGLADVDRKVWAERVFESRNQKPYKMPQSMPGPGFRDPQSWQGSSEYEGMSKKE